MQRKKGRRILRARLAVEDVQAVYTECSVEYLPAHNGTLPCALSAGSIAKNIAMNIDSKGESLLDDGVVDTLVLLGRLLAFEHSKRLCLSTADGHGVE
jgi:hypothetical protein